MRLLLSLTRLASLVVIGAAFVVALNTVFPAAAYPGFAGASETVQRVAWPATIFTVTLLGIWSRAVHEKVTNSTRRSVRLILTKSLTDRTFFMAALVSPIIFGAAYSVTKDAPDTVMALVVAFQNGFFWRTVLQREESARAS